MRGKTVYVSGARRPDEKLHNTGNGNIGIFFDR
jgi:hypothetical protein